MAYFKSFSTLVGVAALASVATALPAQAEAFTAETQDELALAVVETAEATPEASADLAVETPTPEVAEATVVEATVTEEATLETAEVIPADAATTASLLMEPTVPVAFQASDETLISFDDAGLQAALNGAIPDAAPVVGEGLELAQAGRRPMAASVSPAYLGVAGNVGFGDPDSAIGDFGVNVISKISLGPRFALRPGFFISERFTNFAVPLTYNFNTMAARGVLFQPYVGAGVDVPFNGNTALMLNAGADIPISRAFTLNAATNVRVTSGFGMGFSLGVGYNLPFVFQ
ncbi:hypothetical protein [Leptolyngbya sp. BL0902]|uniref:hypothetical protein n=1 Tax=Leptolyngbya sp. BL0902 TaxID=1115757 RepID=UPI0018E77266|nr:hypothetical protein [Leptolyngbya sp. BL0902]